MIKAMSMVEREGMSTAEIFGVPPSTLHDRVAGNVQHGTKPGKHSYLSMQEEDELVNFLFKCTNIGYPKTIAHHL